MNDLEKLEQWKEELKVLQEQKQQYFNDNYHGLDDDSVEWEESDKTMIDFNEKIEELENKIDNMEDYLREKYAPLGE